MATVEDLKAYWQELATKAGLSSEQASAVASALGDEAVNRAFRQGFVPVPEHHSALDQKSASIKAREAELDKWYNEAALPAYQTNLQGIERLRQYESLYGDLDVNNPPTPQTSGLSQSQVDKLVEDKLRQRDQAYTGLTKAVSKMTFDYYKRFGEPLNMDEIEKLSISQGIPPELAYERYIQPKVEEARNKEFEAKLKAAREEGYRDAISKRHIPTGEGRSEYNPFFDRETVPKDTSEVDQERGSRSAFLDGWQNYEAELKPKQ